MRSTAILLGALAAVTTVACGRGLQTSAGDAAGAAPVTAPVVAVERTAIPDLIEAGGVIRARTTATVTSRIMAPVEAVLVAAGDRVRTGQVLARLDARDLGAAARRAVSGRQAADQATRAARAERDAAESALILARATHMRIAALHDRRSATDGELDTAVAGLREAESRAAAADARVAEAAAGLDAAVAAADAATVTAGWATITAPFDGVVTEKLVEPGNMAAPGLPLFRVEERDGLRLEARLDGSRAALVRVGQDVEVEADAPGGVESSDRVLIRGRVVEVSRAVEAGAHAFLIKIDLPPGTSVPSGTYARALFSGAPRQVLSVPASAVVRNGQVASVYAVDGDRVRLRLVNAGAERAGRVEILAGLERGDHVVARVTAEMSDGVRLSGAGR